jgi:hypothetical protein
MAAKTTKKMCGSCKRGEIYSVPADWAIKGYRVVETYNPKKGELVERKQAFRANVCDDHRYCLDQDGAVITEQVRIRH